MRRLAIGAGTGAVYILRWFWWRINAISEVVAMVVSFLVAVAFRTIDTSLAPWQELVFGVGITTASWIAATLLTKPADERTLEEFCRLINPGGPGWRAVYARLAAQGHCFDTQSVNIPRGILCMLLGCAAVYSFMFATGSWLYGDLTSALFLAAVAIGAAFGIVRLRFND